MLQENAGQLMINLLPGAKYMCQRWELPGLSSNHLRQPTPMADKPVHGTKPIFGPLNITFRVDQNLDNYLEVYDWWIGLHPPRSPLQHKEWLGTVSSSLQPFYQKGPYSEATLILFTTAEVPSIEVQFTDLYPTTISSLKFDTTTQNAEELTCEVAFDYRDYAFVKRSVVK